MSSATGKQATFHTKQLVEVGFHKTVTCDNCFREGVATRFKCAQCDDYDLCVFCNRDKHRHSNWRLSLGGNFHEITFKMESDIDDLIAFGVKPRGAPRAEGVGIHDDSHGFYFTSGSPVKVVRGRDNKRRLGSVRLAKGDRVTLVLHHSSKLVCYHTSGTRHVHVGTIDDVSNIYRFAVTITESGQKVSVVDTPARLRTGATAVVTSDEDWLAIQSRLREFSPLPTGTTGVIAALDDNDDSAGLSVDGIDKLLWVPQNCLTMRAPGELACTLKEGDTVVRHPGDSGWRWGDQDGGAGNTGKVVKATDGSGSVSVKWGNGDTNNYWYGGDGRFDVMLRVEVGSRVVRNPFHWKWGNQDGGGVGTVQRIDTSKDQVYVKWPGDSSTYNYRMSTTNADVQVADGALADAPEVVLKPGENWAMETTDSDCALKSGTMSSATGKQATFQTTSLVEVGFHKTVTCDMCFRKGVATCFKCTDCDDYVVCVFCNRDKHRHSSWRVSLGGNFHQITFKMESGIDDLIAFGVKPRGAPRVQGVGSHDDSHGFYFTSGLPVTVVRGRDSKKRLGSVGLAKGDRVTLVLHHSKLECYHTSGTRHVHVGTMDNVSNIYRFAVTITESGQKVSVVDTPARLRTGATAVVTSDEDWLAMQSRLRDFNPLPTGTTGVIAALDDRDDSAGLSVDGNEKLQWVPQKCLNMRARGELACTLKEGDTVVRHPGDSGWRWGGQDGGAGNTGKVVKATDDSGSVSVKWGNGDTNNYWYGGDGKFDVMLRVEVGSRVVRNPFHWMWGNQDGGGVGTVERIDATEDQVHVKWPGNSSTYNYRLSRTHADVQVASSSTRPCSPPVSPVAAEPQQKAAPAAGATARELTRDAFDVTWDPPLGKGAFGTVYRGSYELEPVAIKVVNDVPKEEVLREVQALFEMNHPRIAKVYGSHFDSSQRRMFIVMEQLMHDVESVIKAGREAKRSPCVPWGEFYKLVLGTSYGLREMHRQQYMHRDIKPQNIMVGKDGFPKLVDMGLSKQVSTLQTIQVPGATICGTPCYMAPEVFTKQGGSAADVYALGCTAWEMVDGRVPKSWCDNLLELAVAELPMGKVEQAGTKRSVVDLLRNMTALEADQRPKLDEVVRTLEQEQHS